MKKLFLLIVIIAGILAHLGSGGSDGNTDDDPTITVTTVANPNNILSVYVNWTTATPMNSEVQFGVGGYQFRIRDSTEVTSHNVLVIGMHAETTYLIKAISSKNNNTLQDETTWTTGPLPPGVPEGVMLTNNAAMLQPGWTLMNVQVGNGTFAMSDLPARVIMYDNSGKPVWYYIDGTKPDRGGALSTKFLDSSNTILIGPTGVPPNDVPPREVDLAGNIIWEGPTGPANVTADNQLSHDVLKLSNGHYILLRWMKDAGGGPTDARLEEVTANNQVVWDWNLFDFYTPPEDWSSSDWATVDWCHANSATVDIVNDEVYLSCRWLGLFKTAYNYDNINPELEYHLPAVYNSSGEGDMSFVPPESQFNDIHDPEIHDDGTIMFFDNDGWNFLPAAPGGYHSRILEFAIDEQTKTATLVWEFPGDFDVDPWFTDDFYCPYWGDANRLENGNVIVAAGVRGAGSISHVFEVTNDGEVVWDFTLPEDHGVYRATRINPPLIETL